MKVAVIAVGSQGDVQPLAALGSGLIRLGHEVRLVSHAAFEELARQCRLDFGELPGNPIEIVRGREGQAWLGSGGSSLRFLRHFARIARELVQGVTEAAVAASRGSDALIYGLPLVPIGFTVAELLGVPGIPTSLYPVHPTSDFAPVLAARLPFRGSLTNSLSERAIVAGYCSMVRRLHGTWRRQAGLSRLPNLLASFDRLGVPYLYGYSPAVIPTPRDWGKQAVVCGYWFLPPTEGWRPPAGLEAFLSDGEPPVYVGFGSMPNGDARSVTASVVEALRRAGRRGVLSLGWGGLDGEGLPDEIYPVADYLPHDWLFPRVSAVVHHGGAGTTATALRCGVPQVVVPYFADQFFWGRTVQSLGVGSRPLLRKRLSAQRLAAAIREAADNREVSERARALAERIGKEDGVAAGAAAVDGYLRSTVQRTSP